MKKYVLVVAAVLLALACQQKPTKISVQEPVISEGVTAEKLLKEKAVILDARPAFEFNLAHVPGAINVRWEDFSQNSPRSRGLLQGDLFSLARRLALVGIDPDTKVVVLGKGAQGGGEEGRVAWTLKVLGVKDVYTLVHTSYREMNTTKEAPLVQNKPYWKPQENESLVMNIKDFKKIIAQPGAVVLDVRSAQEFALRNLSQEKKVQASVYNVEWKEFFDGKGLPLAKSEGLLRDKGISKEATILVLSNHGVRSAAVTYALQFLGYKKVSNVAGGYEQWK
ncbi:MAG: ABC transporter ATP-binding protein [Bdellovibrio sp.]|nr:ABC transporter ATP-binding protein [Bdellovibrio sp.]